MKQEIMAHPQCRVEEIPQRQQTSEGTKGKITLFGIGALIDAHDQYKHRL